VRVSSRFVDLTGQKVLTYTDGKVSEGDIPAERADSAATLRDDLMEAIAETVHHPRRRYRRTREAEGSAHGQYAVRQGERTPAAKY
jgi:hypothetical protein